LKDLDCIETLLKFAVASWWSRSMGWGSLEKLVHDTSRRCASSKGRARVGINTRSRSQERSFQDFELVVMAWKVAQA
jgi:hypothetical protein